MEIENKEETHILIFVKILEIQADKKLAIHVDDKNFTSCHEQKI